MWFHPNHPFSDFETFFVLALPPAYSRVFYHGISLEIRNQKTRGIRCSTNLHRNMVCFKLDKLRCIRIGLFPRPSNHDVGRNEFV
jgi:hypothetical protein